MTMANTLYKRNFSISTSTTIYLADSRPTRLWEPNQCETIIYTDLSRSSWVSTFWLHQCQNIHSWNGKSTSEEEMPFTSGYVHNIQFWMPCFTPIMTSSHLFAFLSLGLLLLNQIILLPDSRYMYYCRTFPTDTIGQKLRNFISVKNAYSFLRNVEMNWSTYSN